MERDPTTETRADHAARLLRAVEGTESAEAHRECFRFAGALYREGEPLHEVLWRCWSRVAEETLREERGVPVDATPERVLKSLFARRRGWDTFRGAGGRRQAFERWLSTVTGGTPLRPEGRPTVLDPLMPFQLYVAPEPEQSTFRSVAWSREEQAEWASGALDAVEDWLGHLRGVRCEDGETPTEHVQAVFGSRADAFPRVLDAARAADGVVDDPEGEGHDPESDAWLRRRPAHARRVLSELTRLGESAPYLTPEQLRRLAAV